MTTGGGGGQEQTWDPYYIIILPASLQPWHKGCWNLDHTLLTQSFLEPPRMETAIIHLDRTEKASNLHKKFKPAEALPFSTPILD